MKLQKILEKISPEDKLEWQTSRLYRRSPDSFKQEIERQQQEKDHKLVGTGLFSYVNKIDNPHELDNVRRTARSRVDGGNIFYQYLIDNPQLQSNPWLPRVKGMNRTEAGYVTFKVESLKPFETPSILGNEDLICSLWEHWFTIDLPLEMETATSNDVFMAAAGAHFENLLHDLVINYKPNDSRIKDSKLAQALDIIQEIAYSNSTRNLEADIHTGNIMWRITGNMPHLVIVDPLFNRVGSHLSRSE